MAIQNKIGICSCHNKKSVIVNVRHNLCAIGNRARLDGQKDCTTKLSPKIDKKMLDDLFYMKAWRMKTNICEECNKVLPRFSRMFISHILSKGAFPNLRHNFENYQKLCADCHIRFETGARKGMKTYPEIEKRIQKLKLI